MKSSDLKNISCLGICLPDSPVREIVDEHLSPQLKACYYAETEKEVVDTYRQHHPDLLIIDHQLIEPEHYAALISLKRLKRNIPAIIYRRPKEDVDLKTLIILGYCFVLDLPVCTEKLQKTLQVALSPIIKEKQLISIINIYNNLDEMVVVSDGDDILIANESFLDFFGVPYLAAFKKTHPDFGKLLIPLQGMVKPQDPKEWVKAIVNRPLGHRKIALNNSEQETHKFLVNISQMPNYHNHYIISFNDITVEEQLHNSQIAAYEEELKPQLNAWKEIRQNLTKEMHRFERYQVPFSTILFCLVDREETKEFLDRRDDKVFSILEKLVNKTIRPTDYFGKWQRNLYVILASNTDKEQAHLLIKRLIQECKANFIFKDSGDKLKFSIVQVKQGEGINFLLQRATAGLTKTLKEQGNAVFVEDDVRSGES